MGKIEVKLTPLAFGLAFVGLGVAGLIGSIADVDIESGWLWVVGLVAIGLAMVVVAVSGAIRSRNAAS